MIETLHKQFGEDTCSMMQDIERYKKKSVNMSHVYTHVSHLDLLSIGQHLFATATEEGHTTEKIRIT